MALPFYYSEKEVWD